MARGKSAVTPGGADRFRAFALALPDATEGSHMGSVDFRVGGRIFATLAYVAQGKGTLKLTLEQQAAFLAELPQLFEPAPGGWGHMGMTLLRLDDADDATMQGALQTSYQNVVRKQTAAASMRRKSP
jgi:hypothetical protein